MRKILAYIPIVAVISGSALAVVYLLIKVFREMSSDQLISGGGALVFCVWLAWGVREINREEQP